MTNTSHLRLQVVQTNNGKRYRVYVVDPDGRVRNSTLSILNSWEGAQQNILDRSGLWMESDPTDAIRREGVFRIKPAWAMA